MSLIIDLLINIQFVCPQGIITVYDFLLPVNGMDDAWGLAGGMSHADAHGFYN